MRSIHYTVKLTDHDGKETTRDFGFDCLGEQFKWLSEEDWQELQATLLSSHFTGKLEMSYRHMMEISREMLGDDTAKFDKATGGKYAPEKSH